MQFEVVYLHLANAERGGGQVHSRIEGRDSLKSYRQLMVAGEGRALVSSGVNTDKMPMPLGMLPCPLITLP